MLAELGPEKATTATQALHGIALARLGKMDQAKKISHDFNALDLQHIAKQVRTTIPDANKTAADG